MWASSFLLFLSIRPTLASLPQSRSGSERLDMSLSAQGGKNHSHTVGLLLFIPWCGACFRHSQNATNSFTHFTLGVLAQGFSKGPLHLAVPSKAVMVACTQERHTAPPPHHGCRAESQARVGPCDHSIFCSFTLGKYHSAAFHVGNLMLCVPLLEISKEPATLPDRLNHSESS